MATGLGAGQIEFKLNIERQVTKPPSSPDPDLVRRVIGTAAEIKIR